MRILLAMALGVSLIGSLAAPGWTQTYKVRTEIDDLLFDKGNQVDAATYPDVAVNRQAKQLTNYLNSLITQRTSAQAPILNQDLPSPYTSSIRKQAGYYRTTNSEPLLDGEVLR